MDRLFFSYPGFLLRKKRIFQFALPYCNACLLGCSYRKKQKANVTQWRKPTGKDHKWMTVNSMCLALILSFFLGRYHQYQERFYADSTFKTLVMRHSSHVFCDRFPVCIRNVLVQLDKVFCNIKPSQRYFDFNS